VAEAVVCGPDPDRHREAIDEFEQAGFDHVYVHQVGPDQDGFIRFYEREILPERPSAEHGFTEGGRCRHGAVGRGRARRRPPHSRRDGADVGLVARGPSASMRPARTSRASAVAPSPSRPTSRDADQIEAAAARIEEELGPIDVWVNNAMADRLRAGDGHDSGGAPASHRGHLFGSVWGTMAALRRMVPRDRGVIVQVGSALAYRGIPLQAAYCGSKHALQASSSRCGRSSCTTGRAYG
jgi:hypothetical protein